MHGVSAISRQTLSVYSAGQDKRKMSLNALTKLQQKERHEMSSDKRALL